MDENPIWSAPPVAVARPVPTSVRAQQTGIGVALRKVRLLRGKSIEEASRETRIRAEYLRALEQERFESLMGDVYVRGALRSYSTYLGIDPDKVLSIYNGHFGGPRPTVPDPNPAPVRSPRRGHHELSHVARHHPSWAFLIGVALLALAIFAAAGILRTRSAPGGEGIPRPRASIPVLPPKVTVAIRASVPVQAVIRVDGAVAFDGLLRKDEFRSFEGSRSIDVRLDRGGVAVVTVNGHTLGNPGMPTSTYSATFGPKDFRRSTSSGSSPSVAGSTSPGASPSASSS
jgi:helix-turn-helix protein